MKPPAAPDGRSWGVESGAGPPLVAYGYWHNNAATGAQTGFASNAQRIVGLRAEENGPAGALRANYLGEAAWQRAIGSGDARIAAATTG